MGFVRKRKHLVFPVILVVIAYLVTVGVLSLGAFIREDLDIHVGAIASRPFRAHREIENTFATAILREAEAAEVLPLMYNDADIAREVLRDIEEFFAVLGGLRAEYRPVFNPAAAVNPLEPGFAGVVPPMPEMAVDISQSDFEHIITGASGEFARFFNTSMALIADWLVAGVSAENRHIVITNISGDLGRLDFDAVHMEAGAAIANAFIRPNIIVNEPATNAAREEAMARIPAVMFSAGQNIVLEGEPISEEAFAALVALGYTDEDAAAIIAAMLGSWLIASVVFAIIILYIWHFKPEIVERRKQLTLLFTLFLITMAAARLLADLPFYFTPVILFAMLVAVLIDRRLAMVAAVGASLFSLVISGGDVIMFSYVAMTGAFAALIGRYVVTWARVVRAVVGLLAFCVVVVLANHMLFAGGIGAFTVTSAAYALLGAGLSIMLTLGSLPLWSTLFEVVTPQSLLQLTNPNHPIMRKMTIETPGTYHHSLIVANLAETAAIDIGADHVLARVGSYYHDIGKTEYPQYFSENQNGINPHDGMDPRDSIEVITGHIARGLQMAKRYKLPAPVREFIEQHHGTSLLKVFMYKEMTADPDNPIDEEDFRYKHRLPQSPEVAVMMLADTCEAAVRSFVSQGKSMDEAEGFVRQLIREKMEDGQLNDSKLTIRDLDTIAKAFMRVFRGMYHARVPYPTLKELAAAAEAGAIEEDEGVYDEVLGWISEGGFEKDEETDDEED